MLSLALALALAATPAYDEHRRDAQIVKSLGRFLEGYVGDCLSDDPEFDRRGCEAKATSVRAEQSGKTMRIELDDASEILTFQGWDERRKAFRMHFTPFLSDRGVGFSAGKPTGLTAQGQPIVKIMPLWVALPGGEQEAGFRRQLERGMVRLELVFRPGKIWALQPRSGGAPVRGVAVELVGLRIYARGDQVLAEELFK